MKSSCRQSQDALSYRNVAFVDIALNSDIFLREFFSVLGVTLSRSGMRRKGGGEHFDLKNHKISNIKEGILMFWKESFLDTLLSNLFIIVSRSLADDFHKDV